MAFILSIAALAFGIYAAWQTYSTNRFVAGHTLVATRNEEMARMFTKSAVIYRSCVLRLVERYPDDELVQQLRTVVDDLSKELQDHLAAQVPEPPNDPRL